MVVVLEIYDGGGCRFGMLLGHISVANGSVYKIGPNIM